MRKTKIVCTLGPACDSADTLRQMIQAGMNVARFNFSHGTHEEQKARYDRFVAVREELGVPVAAMLDTKGPEIRLGKFQGGRAELKRGSRFVLKAEPCEGDGGKASISYAGLYRDVTPGGAILLDDGLIELSIESIEGTDIVCRVVNGGKISNNKGVNIPNARFSMPYLSQKDSEDIDFAVDNGFDFIAASFVRSADDVLLIRRQLEKRGSDIEIIAKIENEEGVQNIDEILALSDGIMVARGDMGVEIHFERLPAIQKMIIKKAIAQGKAVITATQMLESMIHNPRPTRAEASDVANAVYDGTGAIMLSGETAAGQYPVEAVRTMDSIALAVESDINYSGRLRARTGDAVPNVTNAISFATCQTADELHAAAIVTVSKSGRTARMISKFRPGVPILCCTCSERVRRRLNLTWGVHPVVIPEVDSTDGLFDRAVQAAIAERMAADGDMVVLTAGVPLGVSGTSNLLKVEVIGNLLISGTGLTGRTVSGSVVTCRNEDEVLRLCSEGDIIVAPYTTNKMIPALKKAAGMIIEQGGLDSHSATLALALDIPTVINATNAMQMLKSGMPVTLDAARGTVCAAKR